MVRGYLERRRYLRMRRLKHKSATTIQAGNDSLAKDLHFFATSFERARGQWGSIAGKRESGGKAAAILVFPQSHSLSFGFFKSPVVNTLLAISTNSQQNRGCVDRLNGSMLWCT